MDQADIDGPKAMMVLINQLRQEMHCFMVKMAAIAERLPPPPVGVVISGDAVDFQLEELVSLDDMESSYIIHVLRVLKENKSKAAEVLGVDPSTLYRKLARLSRDPV